MTTLFYRLDDDRLFHGAPAIPDDVQIRLWRPCTDGLPRMGPWLLTNMAWWAFTKAGLFSSPDFTEVTLWRGGRLVHRLIVTPRWRRFPFMGRDDLQVGDLWTHPNARGQGMARAALGLVHGLFAGQDRRFWYIVQAENEPSLRLIEGCGYTLVGQGRRTAPLGIRFAGSFLLESPTS